MKNYSALFIDDDEGILEALNLYADIREVPLLACRPEKALDFTELYKPKVIFFDYLMAGIDGPGLLKEIRQKSQVQFQAVLVTAHPLIESTAKDRFSGWIKKPFSFAELEKYVTNFKQPKIGFASNQQPVN